MLRKAALVVLWILSFELIGLLLGFITSANIETWYAFLKKPALTPPAIVFSTVWPILYAMLALVGYSLCQRPRTSKTNTAITLYSLQMLMNWLWTILFFYFHLIGFSLLWIIVMALLTLVTIVLTKSQFKLTTLMILPYFIWLLFAVYLNAAIWIMN